MNKEIAKYIQASNWEVLMKEQPNNHKDRFMDLEEAIEGTTETLQEGERGNTYYIYELKAIISNKDTTPKPVTVERV